MARRKLKPRTAKPPVGELVANDEPRIPKPLDVHSIKDLVALMTEHDLTEIDLRDGQLRIRLRRGPLGKLQVTEPAPAPSPSQATPRSAPPPEPKPPQNLHLIKSPTPGTFYSS